MLSIRTAVLCFDDQDLIESVDPMIAPLFGIPVEAVAPGLHVTMIPDAWGVPALDGRLIEIVREGGPAVLVGAPGGLRLTLQMHRRPGGKVVVISDVTARHAVGIAALDDPALLQSILDHVPATISVKDSKRRYAFVNRTWVEVTGVPAAKALGRRFEDLVHTTVDPEARDGLADDVRTRDLRTVAGKEPLLGAPEVMIGPNGDRRILLSNKIPLVRSDGSVFGILSVAVDITDIQRGAETLRRAQEAAEQANMAKSRFLAHMTHELRTPLNAIIGFADILVTELFGPHSNPRYRGYAQAIKNSGEHLMRIIGDILDFSKIESGAFVLADESFDLTDFAQTSIAMLEPTLGVRQVALFPDGEAAGLSIEADPQLLRQVWFNLFSNAIKFTAPEGRITVTARRPYGGGLEIAVTDDGPGVPLEQRAHLFEPYRQADANVRRRHGGTGLGLAISRGLMRAHGGDLRFEHPPEGGTRVVMSLPEGRVRPRS